jgi:DNA-directed RNA polymerase subunit RPC12/RpoP
VRFECSSCGQLVEPASVVAHGTSLAMRCERCGAETVVQPRAKPAVRYDAPVETPAGDDAAWKQVLDAWDVDAAHDAYLGASLAAGRLGDAAARYRGLAGDRDRGERAKKALARVAILAEHALAATLRDRPDPRPLRRGAFVAAAVVCVALVALALWGFARAW